MSLVERKPALIRMAARTVAIPRPRTGSPPCDRMERYFSTDLFDDVKK
jgi:hypothetical protein